MYFPFIRDLGTNCETLRSIIQLAEETAAYGGLQAYLAKQIAEGE